ncbi:MAGE homology domain [Dillenia turbinata]|uniref:MAGE homology domain n=1 Tax=Dillenia turbinata TaxID=194707 RepID=A0AAN8W1V3_9MAGN
MANAGEDFSHFDISKEEKDKLVAEVVRYVLFKSQQTSGCPIRREDLTHLITVNYSQRGLPAYVINEAQKKLSSIFGYELRELQKPRQSSRNLTRSSQQSTLESKSYVIVSQLPADIYRKYVDDENTAHLIGFTYAVIGIVYLAGGRIAEDRSRVDFGFVDWLLIVYISIQPKQFLCFAMVTAVTVNFVFDLRGTCSTFLQYFVSSLSQLADPNFSLLGSIAEALWHHLRRMGISEENDDHPVLGNLKHALEALVNQRYLTKEKTSGPEGNILFYELGERALDETVGAKIKEHVSQELQLAQRRPQNQIATVKTGFQCDVNWE